MKGIMFDLKMSKVVAKKMRLAGKNAMLVYRENWPEPEIRHPNQVKVRTRLGGICATDIHMISLEVSNFSSIFASRQNPFPMGHELVGEVVQKGESVSKLEPGDRVVYLPDATCEAYGFEPCGSCRAGNLQSCYSFVGIGDGSEREERYGGRGNFGGLGGGGFNEYLVGFEKQFFKVPPGIPDEAAVLAEPFATGLHAAARHMPPNDRAVVVIGAGIIGLMVIAAVRALGSKCRIVTVARYPFQAELAGKLGSDDTIVERDMEKRYEAVADATGALLFKPMIGKRGVYGYAGPDMIFDCVGSESSLDDALHLIKSNGKIVIVGMGYTFTKKVDWSLQFLKEVETAASIMYGMEDHRGKSFHAFELALRFIKKNPVLFDGLVTHRYRIADYRSALERARRKGPYQAVKVAFDYRHEVLQGPFSK